MKKAILILSLISLLLITVDLLAVNEVITPGMTITEPGYYFLDTSIDWSNQDDFCITVDTSNVIIDGQGYSISGSGFYNRTERGIWIKPGANNVTIRDIGIYKMNYYAIYSEGKNTIIISCVLKAREHTLVLIDSDGSQINNNSISAQDFYSNIRLYQTDNAWIANNEFPVGAMVAIDLHESDYNRIEENSGEISYGHGISVYASTGNYGSGNNIVSQEGDVGTDINGNNIENDPVQTVNSIVPDKNTVPQTSDLLYNYPNPFNSSTTITYTLATDSRVILTIYNQRGQQITTLVNQVQSAGQHVVHFTADSQMPSGTYFCKLQIGKQVSSRVMSLIK
ncbi:right-handed parallel beta-helix repeat-containing protein [Patescibacteria group bacterium]